MNIQSRLPLISLVLLSACYPSDKNSRLKDAWNEANNPVVMMAVTNEFETEFAKLPLAGRPEKMPWSDHYWPTYHGGITYRWEDVKTKQLDKLVSLSTDKKFAGQLDDDETLQNLRTEVLGYKPYTKEQLAAMGEEERSALIRTLSPAEKLDIYRGAFDYPTVKSERERTEIFATLRKAVGEGDQPFVENPEYVKDHKIPTWFGICHAWAPATILFKEPGPVTLKSADGFEVPMAGSDVKALLSHALDVDRSQQRTRTFLAERCNNDLSDTTKEAISALFDALEPGNMDSIDAQIKALRELRLVDLNTTLAIASYFYNFAGSQEEAKLAFQKLYQRFSGSLSSSASRRKLTVVYTSSLKNFALAGQPDAIDLNTIKDSAANEVKIAACNDTNAGAFHLVITNLMGIQKKSFGIDVTRDTEVWNQAAASYDSRVLETHEGDAITPDAAPGTVKELTIETRFRYTTEEMPAWERFGDNKNLRKHHVFAGDVYSAAGRKYRAYRYRVELNTKGKIIGGSWISEARPDFIWGTGNFIWSSEFSDIEDIYYESI